MNYQKIYNSIIEKRRNNPVLGYAETHHILPKCLGGSDELSNLVRLSAKEHFICHLLLVRIHKNTQNYYKMVKAFFMMQAESYNQKRYINSKLYEKLRVEHSKAMSISQSGKNNSQYNMVWVYNLNLKQNKKILKTEPVPEGWSIGRIIDFDKHLETQTQLAEKQKKKQIDQKNKLKNLSNLYKIYSDCGFEKFVEITKYKHSQQNLVTSFKKLPEFVPQRGKRR